MKILIVKPSSLGDIIHALPALALIRKEKPDAYISWVVNNCDSLKWIEKTLPA